MKKCKSYYSNLQYLIYDFMKKIIIIASMLISLNSQAARSSVSKGAVAGAVGGAVVGYAIDARYIANHVVVNNCLNAPVLGNGVFGENRAAIKPLLLSGEADKGN